MENQAAAWDAPSTEEEAHIKKSYQWLEKAALRDSRGTDHGSTRTGPEHQIHWSFSLQLQTVQRCSRDTNKNNQVDGIVPHMD